MTMLSIFKSHWNSQHTERKLPKHTLFDKLALNKISFSPPIHSDQFILSILFCISASAPVPPPRSCHPTEGNVYSMIRSIYTGHLLAQSWENQHLETKTFKTEFWCPYEWLQTELCNIFLKDIYQEKDIWGKSLEALPANFWFSKNPQFQLLLKYRVHVNI